MHRTFTSGAARRRRLAIFHDVSTMLDMPDPLVHLLRVEINAGYADRVNPILDRFRDDTYPGDPDLHAATVEWLIQLARHWASWQSPRIGTFPLDYRDTAGPATREQAAESGEDRVFWEIDDALAAVAGVDGFYDAERWDLPRATGSEDRIQDLIVHATAVLTRLFTFTDED